MDENDVVIIGAGICGLATALALHKKGIKSVVMERAESLRNTTGAAIGIWKNGWRALDELGVADTLRRTAILIQREQFVSVDGGRRQESIDGEFRSVRRKDLIDTLYAALPIDTVKFGRQLDSVNLEPITDNPILRFTDGSSIISKVVIGCDGGKSVFADFLNYKPTKMFPLCGVRGLTNYPNGHSFGAEFARFRKDNVLVGRIPIDGNVVYWFCARPSVPTDEGNWKAPEVIRQSTLDLLHDYPKEVQEMIENADIKSLSIARLRYRAPWNLLTGTFYKGRVVVAGDAMHVMGPFLGQGGSAGLEDAVVLARNLAQSGLTHDETERLAASHRVEEAFSLYVKQRRARVFRLAFQTYLTGMLLGSPSRLMKIICIVLLFLLFHKPRGHTNYDCGNL